MSINLILLAAGEGTRMQSDRAKVLHEIGSAPIFAHALAATEPLEPAVRVLVVGHEGESVANAARAIDPEVRIVEQKERLGTAHAVLAAKPVLEGASGDSIVLFGDTPFIRSETFSAMSKARMDGADIVVLGFEASDPARYGRLVVNGRTLERIVEWKDATEAEREIRLCNSGVVMADTATLLSLVSAVTNDNAAGEFYLTDIPEIGRTRGLKTEVVVCDEAETLGINTRADLVAAEAVFQRNARNRLVEDGVTLMAPATVYLSLDTHIGRDAVIEPNVVFGPGVTVETGARIRAFSHLEGCHVSKGAIVGPYARLRPGAEIGDNARVGNFVEIKNAEVGEGAKVNHLTYVGDASIGAGSNIGAGTITCNYDGFFKHRTEIGQNVFIGSNTMLVAPVRVGDDAMTATGTVVTRDVPAGDMAVARSKQDNKPGFATRFKEKLRAAKARQSKE